MVEKTITSANSSFLLSVPGLFGTLTRIQGYGPDASFVGEAVEESETQMGIDGRLSAGWTPAPKKQSVTLMADSVSVAFFERWYATERQLREKLFANGTLGLPSIQRKYTLTRGVLTGYVPFSEGGKVLKARTFQLVWEDVAPGPM